MTMNLQLLTWPLLATQIIISSLFMAGFISIYQELSHVAEQQTSHMKRFGGRWLLLLASIGIGTLFHLMGYHVVLNAMMFHNMGLFLLVFTLFDTDMAWWEFGTRIVALLAVWSMHHAGNFDRPQFAISIVLLLIGVGIMWLYGNRLRYRRWFNFGMMFYMSMAFWLLLPRFSAGIEMSTKIAWQAILMFMVMDIAATSYWVHRYHVGQVNARIAHSAHYDALTNAKSYTLYQEEITHLFNLAQQNHEALTLATLDVDHFKQINDTYGHLAGNAVLSGVAETLMNVLKESGDDRYLYRTGGEEFTILFQDRSAEQVRSMVQTIWQAVREQRFDYRGYDVKVTVSIGVTAMTHKSDTVENLYRRADDSLYQSKRNGRDAVTIDGQTLGGKQHDTTVATYVFSPQRVVKPMNGKLDCMASELLVRYYDYAHKRWVEPGYFFVTVATQLRMLAYLIKETQFDTVIVNLNEFQFQSEQTLVLLETFRRQHPSLANIVIEMQRMPSRDVLIDLAPKYHQLQVQLVIDTITATSKAHEFDAVLPYVDGLKFSLKTQETHQQKVRDALVVWSEIAHQNGLYLIVKGIENQQEVDWLVENQLADYLQGYFFDRPVLPRIE